MNKLFALTVIVCFLFVACWPTMLPSRTIYLSPPPDVLFDAGIAIVKDMGFTITKAAKEPRQTIGGQVFRDVEKWTVPYFMAEIKDGTSAGVITVRFEFNRKNVDTITRIDISDSDPKSKVANLEIIYKEIVSRLRAVK